LIEYYSIQLTIKLKRTNGKQNGFNYSCFTFVWCNPTYNRRK